MSDEFDGYDLLAELTADDLAAIDAHVARALAPDSPFRRFRAWKNHLAVTDLVAPLWCEVQYEYGLYGKRHKPPSLRPLAFTSRNGNRIHVHQRVARANDRTLARGKSVHRALEEELRPDKLVVRVVSAEERFGLRLLQLIDGFNQLVTDGITRELPVFAITHAHVVLGVIDEVLRFPPDPPGSPPKKKQRVQETAPLDPPPPVGRPSTNLDPTADPTDGRTLGHAVVDQYELRIVDYKTRRSPGIPLDEDSLSPRLQLMLYHRMLSSLLQPEAFDFDLLWSRLNVDSTKPFSPQFLKDVAWEQRQPGPADGHVHLDRLVSEWTSTVRRNRPGFAGVSPRLQIVYRGSVLVPRRRDNGKRETTKSIDAEDPFQEERDLARAIEESLGEIDRQEAGCSSVGGTSTARSDLVAPLDADQTDPMLAWAIQESLQALAHDSSRASADNSPEDDVSPSEKARQETTIDMSPIIGTRDFGMNDDELDTHLADVLQWWLGLRPPRGVDVGQTNRCFSCEYRDSCEWREQKARDAATIAVERQAPASRN